MPYHTSGTTVIRFPEKSPPSDFKWNRRLSDKTRRLRGEGSYNVDRKWPPTVGLLHAPNQTSVKKCAKFQCHDEWTTFPCSTRSSPDVIGLADKSRALVCSSICWSTYFDLLKCSMILCVMYYDVGLQWNKRLCYSGNTEMLLVRISNKS